MSARKIQDETEAREHIAKMRESGLTLTAWARSAGIDGRSLHAWNVNLSRRDSNASRKTTKVRKAREIKLVELVPMSSVARSTRYIVQVGQLAIDVDAQFEETTLRHVSKQVVFSFRRSKVRKVKSWLMDRRLRRYLPELTSRFRDVAGFVRIDTTKNDWGSTAIPSCDLLTSWSTSRHCNAKTLNYESNLRALSNQIRR